MLSLLLLVWPDLLLLSLKRAACLNLADVGLAFLDRTFDPSLASYWPGPGVRSCFLFYMGRPVNVGPFGTYSFTGTYAVGPGDLSVPLIGVALALDRIRALLGRSRVTEASGLCVPGPGRLALSTSARVTVSLFFGLVPNVCAFSAKVD